MIKTTLILFALVLTACSSAPISNETGEVTQVDASPEAGSPSSPDAGSDPYALILCGKDESQLRQTTYTTLMSPAPGVLHCSSAWYGPTDGPGYWLTCCLGECGEYQCGRLYLSSADAG